ncbi:MAG: hypothetical protein ACLPUT_00260 [Solirubrobacteraceae bacterium]
MISSRVGSDLSEMWRADRLPSPMGDWQPNEEAVTEAAGTPARGLAALHTMPEAAGLATGE